MKRRQFIKLSSSASVMALAPFQVQAAFKTFLPFLECPDVSDRKLVVIFLNGGNDGLNTLVPIAQYDRYKELRPTIYVPKNTEANGYINLDGTLSSDQQMGLHPSASLFKGLYENNLLRIIHNVGYPSPNKSHFKSTDLYSTGNDGKPNTGNSLQSGWMGRFFEAEYPELISNGIHPPGIQLGTTAPSLGFKGDINSALSMNLKGQDIENFYNGVAGGLNGFSGVASPEMGALNTDYTNNLKFVSDIDLAANLYAGTITNKYKEGERLEPANVKYEQEEYRSIRFDDLANQLRTVARLIRGGLETKIYMVQISGFDTHANQVTDGEAITGRHQELLHDLSYAVDAFMHDISQDSIHESVVGITFSEFGRKAAQNGNDGTDHGQSAPMFAFGTPVQGGVSGNNPYLGGEGGGRIGPSEFNNYQIEDLDYDYRQVFASLLQNFLGANDTSVDNAFLDYSSVPDGPQSFTKSKLNELLKSEYDVSDCITFSSDNPSVEKKWLLYPNPVKDIVNFSTTIKNASNVSYKVYNTSGKLLMSQTSPLEFGQLNINVKHLASGLYIFQIKANGSTEVHKVVKI